MDPAGGESGQGRSVGDHRAGAEGSGDGDGVLIKRKYQRTKIKNIKQGIPQSGMRTQPRRLWYFYIIHLPLVGGCHPGGGINPRHEPGGFHVRLRVYWKKIPPLRAFGRDDPESGGRRSNGIFRPVGAWVEEGLSSGGLRPRLKAVAPAGLSGMAGIFLRTSTERI